MKIDRSLAFWQMHSFSSAADGPPFRQILLRIVLSNGSNKFNRVTHCGRNSHWFRTWPDAENNGWYRFCRRMRIVVCLGIRVSAPARHYDFVSTKLKCKQSGRRIGKFSISLPFWKRGGFTTRRKCHTLARIQLKWKWGKRRRREKRTRFVHTNNHAKRSENCDDSEFRYLAPPAFLFIFLFIDFSIMCGISLLCLSWLAAAVIWNTRRMKGS